MPVLLKCLLWKKALSRKETEPASSWRQHLIKRTLPLVLLGIAIALAVARLTSAITYDIDLRILVTGVHRKQLRELQILLTEPGTERVLSTVRFYFDAEHEPPAELRHSVNLPSGEYSLLFKMSGDGQSKRSTTRRMVVSEDATCRFSLP